MNMEIANKEKQYKSDRDFIYSCQYHVIFCPKYRRSVLIGDIEKRAKELIKEKELEYNYLVLDMEIMPDHVHLLLDVSPKEGIYKIVSKIKGYLSNTLRKEFPDLRKKLPTLWTNSRFISTVGSVSLEVVKKYIMDQKNK